MQQTPDYSNRFLTSTPICLHTGSDHVTIWTSRSQLSRAFGGVGYGHCRVADPAAGARRAEMGAVGYLVIAAGAVWWLRGIWCRNWVRRCLKRRTDHQWLWMAAFRPEDRPNVDALLTAICDAFFVPRRHRFRMRPSDDIHKFYRRNMRGSLADSLEYESLAIDLERDGNIAPDVFADLLSARPCAVGTLVRVIAQPIRTRAVRTGVDRTREE